LYLTVPSRWTWRTKPLEEDDSCDSPSSDLFDIPTRPDTPEPDTPLEGQFLPQFLCAQEFGDGAEETPLAYASLMETFRTTSVADTVEVDAPYESFEEDDSLPPLDGWCRAYLPSTDCG
jgi:hypothetical protein